MATAITNRQRRIAIPLPRLAGAARRALAGVGRPAGDVEIDVVDDPEIRRLNHRFRGVRRRTDVLAFPLEIEGRPGCAGASPSVTHRGVKGGPSSPPFIQLVGQIVISAQTAARQARRLGVPVALEMELLVTHGILHLIGYDDRDPVEADLMHRRERDILSAGARRPPDRLWRGLLPFERRLRRRNPSVRLARNDARRAAALPPQFCSSPAVGGDRGERRFARPGLAPPDRLGRGSLPFERRLRRRSPLRSVRAVGGVGEERRSLPPTFK